MKVTLCLDSNWLLSADAFNIFSSCMYDPTYKKYKTQMNDYLTNPSINVYVCESHETKTGIMVLKISGAGAEIIGIAVTKKVQHRGVGKYMIQQVVKIERLNRIEAQTDDDSIGFYRKCGFHDERIVIDYPDGSAVRYNCVLNI